MLPFWIEHRALISRFRNMPAPAAKLSTPFSVYVRPLARGPQPATKPTAQFFFSRLLFASLRHFIEKLRIPIPTIQRYLKHAMSVIIHKDWILQYSWTNMCWKASQNASNAVNAQWYILNSTEFHYSKRGPNRQKKIAKVCVVYYIPTVLMINEECRFENHDSFHQINFHFRTEIRWQSSDAHTYRVIFFDSALDVILLL